MPFAFGLCYKSTMKIIVRAATAADLSALCELSLQSNEYHTANAPYFFQIPPEKWVLERYSAGAVNSDTTFLVAELNGKVVGFVRAELRPPPTLPILAPVSMFLIEEVVVDQNYRRKGIARALMAEVENAARAKGITHIHLNVWGFNGSAKALYENLGYTVQRSAMMKELD